MPTIEIRSDTIQVNLNAAADHREKTTDSDSDGRDAVIEKFIEEYYNKHSEDFNESNSIGRFEYNGSTDATNLSLRFDHESC
mgnify:CR=1 FL=1